MRGTTSYKNPGCTRDTAGGAPVRIERSVHSSTTSPPFAPPAPFDAVDHVLDAIAGCPEDAESYEKINWREWRSYLCLRRKAIPHNRFEDWAKCTRPRGHTGRHHAHSYGECLTAWNNHTRRSP